MHMCKHNVEMRYDEQGLNWRWQKTIKANDLHAA